jgi:hypothetical protein
MDDAPIYVPYLWLSLGAYTYNIKKQGLQPFFCMKDYAKVSEINALAYFTLA